MIAIIDYDAGNLKSVEKALVFLGGNTGHYQKTKKQLLAADQSDPSRCRCFWRCHGASASSTDWWM